MYKLFIATFHKTYLTLNMFGPFQVKYKEKYEKEKGKPMLDFETPTYVSNKEAQHMQSQVNTLLAFVPKAVVEASFASKTTLCLIRFKM